MAAWRGWTFLTSVYDLRKQKFDPSTVVPGKTSIYHIASPVIKTT